VWDGGALTWTALDGWAGAFAEHLAARGTRPGDRLALDIGNRPEFLIALLGGLRAGATVAPLDVLLKAEERQAILDDLGPRLVVEVADVAAARAPIAATPAAAGPDPSLATDRSPASDRAPALVLYTSGSTGRPKGAVLSQAALAFANRSWAEPVMALTPDDVVLTVLPLAHSFGLNGALLAPLLAGARPILLERFSPEAVLEAIARHRVTVFPGVATMFRRLLESPALSRTDLSSLRLCVSGAAPLPWDLACAWRERTGIRILRGYGMTELFRPLSYLAADPTDLPDAVGRPVSGVEIRLLDPSGGEVRPGDVGELLVKSPATMLGYLESPEETDEVLRDGWFHTGDLARVTPDGYVSIVGRKRERILRGGHSVFPAEVEAVLLAHPAVSEAAVVGVPDADLGEDVAAFVTLRDGAAADRADLVAWCRERLAAFKYPRRIVVVASLPRSATGKILKGQLRPPGS
jgi:long-chain acyl-CoA synthetase